MHSKPQQKDAYDMILDAIDGGIYRPGSRLVESELAERFGVSRTPVREALQRLETQSLLTRDGRSLIVASLDHAQMAELYAVRTELEAWPPVWPRNMPQPRRCASCAKWHRRIANY